MNINKAQARAIVLAASVIGLWWLDAPLWAATGFGIVISYLAFPEAP